MSLLLLLLVNTILALNIIFLKSTIIGAVFLVLYLAANGYLAGRIVKKLLDVKGAVINWLIAVFLVFSLVSFAGGVAIVLYRFDSVILAGIIIIVSLACLLGYRQFGGDFSSIYKRLKPKFLSMEQVFSQINFQSWRTALYIAIGLLFFIGFYTAFASAAPAEHIITPWQALPAQFAWVIVLLSALILGFIFFKPAKYLLIFIILFSFLQHFYIPAVYRLPYGLDDLRHVGFMEKIAANGVIEPLKIKDAVVSSKLSYSNFWAGGLFLRESLNINFVRLTVWWQAIFFSLFLPVLMWVLGKMIWDRMPQKTGGHAEPPLLAAFLPALFYPFQFYGSVSLPVGLNFLFFLFFLITVIAWLNGQNNKLKYIIVAEFILMFFGYVVYWLIAGLIIGFLIINKFTENYHQSIKKKLIRIVFLFISLIFIPIISLWTSPNARFDILTTQMDYFKDFWAHNLQYLTGFKRIGSPRPQAGNLIWHDMGGQQYFDTVLLVILVILLILGLRQLSKKAEKSAIESMILYMFMIAIGSIFLDRYYFGGMHLLTERMDLIVDLSLLFILIFNFKFFSPKANPPLAEIFKLCLIIFLSFAIASTYISGPVYGRATEPHYQAVELIYQDMQENHRQNYCVLSEHFPLAALEAVSQGRIVNGNFPIEYGYLEEGGKLFIKMFSKPDVKWIKQAMELNKADGCYFILDSRFTADWNLAQIRWILGREIIQVDDVRVWRYDRN
ncbi:MAG: hypothetical protein ABH896_00970 [Candidatus Jacksonbacteria bacterium]